MEPKSPQEIAEAIRANIVENVARYGMSVIGVMSDGVKPSFSYTIGMTNIDEPELIVFGIPAGYASAFFNEYYAQLKSGARKSEVGVLTEFFNLPVYLVDAGYKATIEYTLQAEAYFGKPLKYRQVVLSDRNGKLPWEEGFESHFVQPLLGAPN